VTKKKHHHSPAAYLAGFTREESKSGRLHVLHLRTGKEWLATPYTAGHQRDFYRVKGEDPEAFENELMRLENAALHVIRRVHETLDLPTGRDFDVLLEFVACMAGRTPPTRANFDRSEEKLFEVMQDVYAAHPEALRALKERTLAAHELEPDFHALEFVEQLEASTVKLSTSWSVDRLRDLMEIELGFLRRMSWGIAIPKPGLGPLVCSDLAAVLHNPQRGPHWMPPGFGDKEAEFTFPLSWKMLLIGRWNVPSRKYLLDAPGVAIINERTTRYAFECYSPTEDFLCRASDGSLGRKARLLADIAEANARRSANDEGEDEE
jgi:hypothetical protein